MAKGDKKGNGKLRTKEYEKELVKLQARLCILQDYVKTKGLRVIIVFEGRDAAGKGGIIRALTERVSPRVFRVAALPAPSDREKTQLYVQRYVERFPAGGEVVIFDRSWYNRAGVELVMGFTPKKQVKRFLQLCPFIEDDRRQRHPLDQDLGRGGNGGTGAPLRRPDQRSASPVEAEPDGRRVVDEVVRLLARA